MAAVTTFDTVGQKEDISNIISRITPEKVPFQTEIGTEKIHRPKHEWQEDELRAAQKNAKTQAHTYTDSNYTPTVMRDNWTQILSETINISGTLEATDHYGRASELAKELGKVAPQLKRDLELSMVGNAQVKVAPASNATAGEFASYQAQIDAGNIVKTGGASTAMTEDNLLDMLTILYNEGADVDTIMVTPADSLVLAGFANAAGRTRDIQNKKEIVNTVNLYVSPVGEVAVKLNRFLRAEDTLVYDKANWKKLVLRNWFRETLAKVSDSTRIAVTGEFSLKHANYKASGLITKAA